jgi:hypothetical protein
LGSEVGKALAASTKTPHNNRYATWLELHPKQISYF